MAEIEYARVVGSITSDQPWLVLVHGMSQNHLVFDRQTEAFSSAFRILLIDLPGHGLAIDHAGPFGHREYADHITQALNQHGIDCAHYWATHTGTAAGLLIAAECPDRFRSLILEGPVLPGRNVPSVTAEVARVRKIAAEEGIDAAISSWWSNAPWFKHMRANPEACRAEQHKAVIESFSGRPWLDDQTARAVPDVTENLANTEIRTLIYNGEFDHPEFLAEASHLSNLLPAARCEIVANAGGFPSWEQPHATNRMVSEFLGTVA